MDHRVEVTRGRVYCAEDIERAGNRASDYRRDEVTRRNEEQRSQSEGGFTGVEVFGVEARVFLAPDRRKKNAMNTDARRRAPSGIKWSQVALCVESSVRWRREAPK